MKRLKVFKSRNDALDAYIMWLDSLVVQGNLMTWKGRIGIVKDRITGLEMYAVSIVRRNTLTNQTFTRLLLEDTNEDCTHRRI